MLSIEKHAELVDEKLFSKGGREAYVAELERKIDGHTDEEICRECGGECCKRFPGACFPEDFDVTFDTLGAFLQSHIINGAYVIDGSSYLGYYIRPVTRQEGIQAQVVTYTNCSACFFLHATGCILPHKNRPKECRELTPKLNEKREHRCYAEGCSKEDAVKAWAPFQEAIKHFINKE